MDIIEYIDPENGRKYQAYVDDQGGRIIKGPPEGLVDSLNLPEPFATKLHNVLYDRGIFDYATAARGQNLVGALQEALLVDAQILLDAFRKMIGG